MQKRGTSVLIITLASLLLSWMHCPLYEVFDYDRELFRYMGMAIVKGQTPYLDFFDHKPPLIYLIHAVGYLMGNWGIFVISSVAALFSSLVFYKVCLKYRLPVAWLLPVIFNILLHCHYFSLGIGLTREYTTIALLLFFCVLVLENRYRYYYAGVLIAFTFFLQQDQVLLMLPLIAYDLLVKRQTPLFRKLLQIGIGKLLITIPLIGWLYSRHALAAFWQDAFVFNKTWYAQPQSPVSVLKFLTDALAVTGFMVPLLLAGILAFFSRRGSDKKALLFCALLTVLLSPLSHFISGRPIFYHLQPLAAGISILLFVVFAYNESVPATVPRKAISVLTFLAVITGPLSLYLPGAFLLYFLQPLLLGIILLCFAGVALPSFKTAAPVLTFGVSVLVLSGWWLIRPHLPEKKRIAIQKSTEYHYLQSKQLSDGQLYAFCDTRYVYLYNQFHILSPSKWLYHHFWFWYPDWDQDGQILNAITAELEQRQTIYIIDGSDEREAFVQTIHYQRWKSYLQAHYVPVLRLLSNSKGYLWKRK